MIVEIFIFIVTFIVLYVYYNYKKTLKQFEDKGVKYDPGYPIFGNAFNSITNRGHLLEDLDKVYKKFPDEKYVGYIEGTSPIILVRDPEIIKQITVKDFDHFVNRKQFFAESDSLFGGSLLSLKDDKWYHMRATLSPAFTGSKMRHMMPFITQISVKIMGYLKDHLKNVSDIVHVDDIIRRYTNDVIASTAFGLEVDSFKDKDNDFLNAGQTVMKFTLWQNFLMFFMSRYPEMSEKMNLQLLPAKTIKFFQDIVSNTIDYRKKNNVERPDMIQLLMETNRDWTQNEIIGQAFVFFFAGFETSANALVLTIHELALNPHIEHKLYQEIRKHADANSDFTFESVNDLKYMNCVLNEVLRKWSPAIFLDRTCTKAYELPPPREGGKPVILKPGDVVYNIVNCIHTDPQHYAAPNLFDPERFNDENKQHIKPFTFMPFGEGPRNCIGSRFALLELKVLLYHFVLNFKTVKCERTMNPVKLDSGFRIAARGGTWVRLETRTK